MDIYTALHKDHEQVRELLEKLERATELDKDTTTLLTRIRDLLIPHSRAEEEVFYNSIRQCSKKTGEVMHGFREHLEAETLLRTLQGMAMIGVEWTAAAKKLRESVNHHIEDEEKKIFPQARKLFDDEEAKQLGKAFVALKPEIREDGMLVNMLHMVRNMLPPRLQSQDEEEGKHEKPRARRSA